MTITGQRPAAAPQPPDAQEARPWRPDDGPIDTLLYESDVPGMWVFAVWEWRYGVVRARHRYAGRIVYQVDVTLPNARDGVLGSYTRLYAWPQPGLRPIPRSPGR